MGLSKWWDGAGDADRARVESRDHETTMFMIQKTDFRISEKLAVPATWLEASNLESCPVRAAPQGQNASAGFFVIC